MKKLRIVSLALAAVLMAGILAGCSGKGKNESEPLPYAINEMDGIDIIDDLPDWTGEQLDLSVWYGAGTNNVAIGRTKTNDKFQGELTRATGISFSEKTSFDNGGESCDARIAKMVSTKSWPHIGIGVEGNIATMLFEEDKIYDLTEMVPKYMPNYMSYVNSHDDIKREFNRRLFHNGKMYSWTGLSKHSSQYLDPEYTPERYKNVTPMGESRNWVWVRDDILKTIRPEAHTAQELKDIYMQKGSFTKEQILDYTITSMDEFKKLLQDIKALNITENGRTVWPFYISEGTDNWSLLAEMDALAGTGYGDAVTYFGYYDVQKQKLVNPAKEDWFKDLVKFFNELYREGLASEEAFIDTKAAFDQKKNNGEYAILYGLTAPPSDEVLAAGGKNYSYRKVFIDIPVDHSRFLNVNANRLLADYNVIFFKDMLNETQVEQILRFLDFFYTDAGMKFAMWGPEKSGLYKVNDDGTFEYTDKKFESAMLYNGDDQVMYDYGYKSFPVITTMIGGSTSYFNKFHPQLMYANKEKERVASNYVNEFKISKVIPKADYPRAAQSWVVYNYTGQVPGVKKMWDARQVIEDALKAVLASKTEDAFEKAYKEFVAIEERNGYDDACLDEFNKVFNEINADYMDDIRNWKEK
ncbi:MAG: hypothetical protein E7412_00465 [Ruminococcaceae bacterium]|nr:hypothetical protein [Oscillospiraceae bacterium]